ncbi:MAG: hypothetical protein V1705_00775 [bacterium]
MKDLEFLRKRYLKFVYENYSYKISKNNLEIIFSFKVEPDIEFTPKIVIENIPDNWRSDLQLLDNLIFHLGLIEIPSYWKAACSPIIEIRAGFLSSEQIIWWKKIFIDGMGQFYYENKINWRKPNFLTIKNPLRSDLDGGRSDLLISKLKDRYLVPFAGGRDSIITLEGLKKLKKDIILFTVNPIKKIQEVVRVSGIKKQIIVRRFIDKKLLDLNKKGYLNGHTPFTALLSFISVLCAALFDYKNVAFSNEKSANEGNAKYFGKIINHQWAKSLTFEKMLKEYCGKYLAKNINYFSYLRKYGELEISKMLTKYHKYFPVFSSCNAGMKIGDKGQLAAKKKWCGNCPKCLFVYMTLYPFLEKKQLLKIFDQDIFENKKLLPTMKGLLGQGSIKPFECVGTKAESRQAFKLCQEKAKKSGRIPYLLTRI